MSRLNYVCYVEPRNWSSLAGWLYHYVGLTFELETRVSDFKMLHKIYLTFELCKGKQIAKAKLY